MNEALNQMLEDLVTNFDSEAELRKLQKKCGCKNTYLGLLLSYIFSHNFLLWENIHNTTSTILDFKYLN